MMLTIDVSFQIRLIAQGRKSDRPHRGRSIKNSRSAEWRGCKIRYEQKDTAAGSFPNKKTGAHRRRRTNTSENAEQADAAATNYESKIIATARSSGRDVTIAQSTLDFKENLLHYVYNATEKAAQRGCLTLKTPDMVSYHKAPRKS